MQESDDKITEDKNQTSGEDEYYKTKYRDLKRTLKTAVTNNEYLKNELKFNQKKLQILEEDKYFLLERLLTHEKPPDSPEPPSQEASDSEHEQALSSGNKRSKLSTSSTHPGGVTFTSSFSKVKPLKMKKTRKPKVINEYLDSPSCLASLDEDETNNFSLHGAALDSYNVDEESD